MKSQAPETAAAPAELEKGPLWKTVAPWLGAVAVIAYLFFEVPVEEVVAAAREAQLKWFVPGVLLAVIFWFLLDSLAFSYLISQFSRPLSWAEARAMRGVTYLLAAVNWNIGTAGIVFYLRRFKGVPALESTSSVLFYSIFDILVLLTFAFVGARSIEASAELGNVEPILAGLLLTVGVALAALLSDFPNWGWLRRVRAWSVFRSHRLATRRDATSPSCWPSERAISVASSEPATSVRWPSGWLFHFRLQWPRCHLFSWPARFRSPPAASAHRPPPCCIYGPAPGTAPPSSPSG